MTHRENGSWNMDTYELIPVDTSIEPNAETQEKSTSLQNLLMINIYQNLVIPRIKFYVLTTLYLTPIP